MTKDLPVGDALDVLVAENVMGWMFAPISDTEQEWLRPIGEGLMERAYYVLPFSTDIRAAWEVVEKLGGFVLQVHPVRDGSGRKHYGCYFYLEYNHQIDALNVGRAPSERVKMPPHEPWHVEIDTAPLAICRAALAAVGATP